jgi:hypothetical protein
MSPRRYRRHARNSGENVRVVLRRVLILACSLLLLQIASDVWPQSIPRLSGVGYVDYRNKPRFKVGDWVKYRFSSKSEDGRSEDYNLTILISGEEKFWGDDCFWLETWASGKSLPSQSTAILMSYSIFGDTAWLQHVQVYQRKTARLNEDRQIEQELTHRVLGGKVIGDTPSLTVLTDSLGADTVTVGRGLFRCTKVVRKAGVGSVDEHGDSTVRIENWDRRTLYLSPRVPITSLVREVDDRWVTRKAWKVGKSAEAAQSYLTRGIGTLDLVEWGSGGLSPRLTPVYARRSLPGAGASRPAKPPGARKRS